MIKKCVLWVAEKKNRKKGGLELPSLFEASKRRRGRREEERTPCVQGGDVGNLGKGRKLTALMEDEQ